MKRRLGKKGISLTQVLAVSIILSFSVLQIYRLVNQSFENNIKALESREAFNNSEFIYLNLFSADNSGIFVDVESNEVVMYDYNNCTLASEPLRSAFTSQSYCRSLFEPNLNYTYANDQVKIYIYKHDQTTFDLLADPANNYPLKLREYAANYSGELYYSGIIKIYGVSIIVEFDNYTNTTIYNQVIG